MDDSEIVQLFFARSENAINEVSKKYKNYCRKIAENITGSSEDAEECVNDALMKAWEIIPPHRPNILSTFLGKITRNIAINARKRALAEKRGGGGSALVFEELSEMISGSAGVEQEQERRELINEINAFLGKLPERKRNIFVCRYWYCDSIRDIAAEFATTENNVSVILNRTRKQLREHLQKRGFDI